jgi:hypothetical protein
METANAAQTVRNGRPAFLIMTGPYAGTEFYDEAQHATRTPDAPDVVVAFHPEDQFARAVPIGVLAYLLGGAP